MYLLLLFFLILPICSTNLVEAPQLQYVQVLFNTGERMPYPQETYPRDPFKSSIPVTLAGRLTNKGIVQMRRLGKKLREKYADVMAEDIRVFSAESKASKESMELVLRELIGEELDVDELMDPRRCRRFTKEIERVRKNHSIKKSLNRFEGLYR